MMNFEKTAATNADPETLVLFASYEERCVGVSEDLMQQGWRGRVYILHNTDVASERRVKNLRKLKIMWPRASLVGLSVKRPTPMLRFVNKFIWDRRILVDITCFNRENLFAFW